MNEIDWERTLQLSLNGLAVILSMTTGVNLTNKAFVSLWKIADNISPFVCAGCQLLDLS